MSKIIGIDLGTGASCVSVMEGGKPTIIVNAEGNRTTPSVVGFTENDIKVGNAAKRQATMNAKNTVYSIKRFIGNTFNEVKDEVSRVPYTVVKGKNNIPVVDIDGKKYTPQEISAKVLMYLKKAAEDYLGETVSDAVITVPAYFSDSQRKATKDAGEIAGLNVRRIINEPTAAALAYGMDKLSKNQKIAVFDIGCGTYDLSILEIGDGVFEVLSTDGNTHLGGDDFDNEIVNWLAEEFISENPSSDLRKDSMSLQRLKEAAEKAKIELSSNNATEINLPYITAVDGVPKHLVKTLTRAKFESMIEKLVISTLEPCKNALKNAKLTVDDIDEVILVGGSTRIPLIQETVKNFFGKEPNKSVNPDEVVSMGAAIQGSVLNGENKDILLLDVTPLNLNITTMGEIAMPMIEANTTIPVSKTNTFSTAVDNQPGVQIVVTQGNRSMAKDNKQIGEFNLDGIAPAPRGIPQIEVTFSIDSNGILCVTAKDKATGKDQSIRIEGSSGLDDAEIQRMKEDAEAHAEEDKRMSERLQRLNMAESAIYSTEKQLKEYDEKLTDAEKTTIKEAYDSLKAAYNVADNERDLDAIDEAVKKLNEEWGKATSRIYSENGSPSGMHPGFDNMFNGAQNK